MKLTELQPQFVRSEVRVETWKRLRSGIDPLRGNWTDADFEDFTGPRSYHVHVATLAEADGIYFLCPKCYQEAPPGPVGTHGVLCWFVGKVPDDIEPKPGRWTPTGSGFGDLSFVPGSGRSNSVLLLGGCAWHGFVTNGEVT